MSLLEEARAEVQKTGVPCALTKAHQLFPELAAEVDEVVYSDLPATAVMRALARHGIKISDWAVQKHRRGDCPCRS